MSDTSDQEPLKLRYSFCRCRNCEAHFVQSDLSLLFLGSCCPRCGQDADVMVGGPCLTREAAALWYHPGRDKETP